MGQRTIAVSVTITRFVQDHQPGIVECEFADDAGIVHRFIDKIPMFSEDYLDADSHYPCPGVLICEVVDSWEENGRKIVRVSTEHPWSMESLDGTTSFDVSPAILVEWEWGNNWSRHPWSEEG